MSMLCTNITENSHIGGKKNLIVKKNASEVFNRPGVAGAVL